MPEFRWEGPPLLSGLEAKRLLASAHGALSQIESTLDLGRTSSQALLRDGHVQIGRHVLRTEWLAKAAENERHVYRLDREPPESVRIYSNETGWVRALCATDSAPTVLVSGIPMHRIKGTDPLRDTETKIAALGHPQGCVLDTATGLGYTAIALARSAREVVTIEIDPAALEIARLNPWSAELFQLPRIRSLVGDVAEHLRRVPDGAYSAVLHDPPTISLAGDLYGLAFYHELRRVLARGGRLFHYVGDPDSGHGKKVMPGVMRRLGESGFGRIERCPAAFGVVATAL